MGIVDWLKKNLKKLCASAERRDLIEKEHPTLSVVKQAQLTLHESVLDLPLRWKKPQIIFVNSMSDLFHEDVPEEFIYRVFDTMGMANWHQYQVLTKRSTRLRQLSPQLPWQKHIWMGVTVENSDHIFRIDDLRQTLAKIKFLSLEPLLGPMPELNLEGIDWVIVGGESGPGARPMKPEWVIDIKNQCQKYGVKFVKCGTQCNWRYTPPDPAPGGIFFL